MARPLPAEGRLGRVGDHKFGEADEDGGGDCGASLMGTHSFSPHSSPTPTLTAPPTPPPSTPSLPPMGRPLENEDFWCD